MVKVIRDRKYKNLIGMENFVEFVVSGLKVEAELSRLRLVKFVTSLSYTRILSETGDKREKQKTHIPGIVASNVANAQINKNWLIGHV
jgi:hypothetical protein